ncbi:uncharacterized protein LOC134189705 [Corticium candelabrum]|uniref:uncharacterized protein LOC134189705 n=1 Tax=Corticium candelabrum TaxID=121492 RepID=UPI002E275A43|nr:uncharacterized protein LOC134189705 [Corticium candelabrum]
MNNSEYVTKPRPKKACSGDDNSCNSQEMREDLEGCHEKRPTRKKFCNTGSSGCHSQAVMQKVEGSEVGESDSKRSGRKRMHNVSNSSCSTQGIVEDVESNQLGERDSSRSSKKRVHWDPEIVESLEELLVRLVTELRTMVRGQQEVRKKLDDLQCSLVKELRMLCFTLKDTLEKKLDPLCRSSPRSTFMGSASGTFMDFATSRRHFNQSSQPPSQILRYAPHINTADSDDSDDSVTPVPTLSFQLPPPYKSPASSVSAPSVGASTSSSVCGEQGVSSKAKQSTRLALQLASAIIGDDDLVSAVTRAGGIRNLPLEKLNEIKGKSAKPEEESTT